MAEKTNEQVLSLSDDNVFDIDEKPTQEHYQKIDKHAADAAKSIKIDDALTEETKLEIEKNKKKRKKKEQDTKPEKKKEIEEELEWNRNGLSEEEMAESLALQDDLRGFIKTTTKGEMAEGSGVKMILPTGIDVLDTVAGGGFAAGALTVLVGNPGTFKSAMLGQVIGAAQRKYRGKVHAAYMDSEVAMSKARLAALGAKYPPITPYTQITIEDVFRMIELMCVYKEKNECVDIPSIIAWDSVANTVSQKERDSDEMDPAKFLGLRARIISFLLPKYISKLEEYNIGLFAVNQLRDKIDLGIFKTSNDLRWIGDKNFPGGNSLKFNSYHLLLFKVAADLKPEQWGFTGVHLKAKFVKNKLFQPNIEIDMIVDFNHGISNFWTNYLMLTKFKRMNTGAWNHLISMPEQKFRTKDAYNKYKSEKEWRTEFDLAVKETIKTEYIDKYGIVEDE